jgi:hypothetical protein
MLVAPAEFFIDVVIEILRLSVVTHGGGGVTLRASNFPLKRSLLAMVLGYYQGKNE